MERLRRVCIVLNLLDRLKEKGSWCGETHIQKAMYFLQEVTNVPTEFDFIMYKHGPFSFDLRDELGAIRSDGLLELKMNPYPYGPSFAVTELGRALQHRFLKTLDRYNASISRIAKALGNRKVAELERLATALYVIRELDSPADIHERASLINRIKPHVSPEQAIQAVLETDAIISSRLP